MIVLHECSNVAEVLPLFKEVEMPKVRLQKHGV